MPPHHSPLLAPPIALALWTFFIWGWMYATRIPAILDAKMELDPNAPRGEQMAKLPAKVRWKADNYNHLFEQPTLFYAVTLVLAVAHDESTTSVAVAWAYVASRVVHSLIQTTVNVITVRFAAFVVSSLILLALTIHAAFVVF